MRAHFQFAEPSVIGPLHDPVTWYKIKYTSEQVAQWDFQDKGEGIVLKVPLGNLITSILLILYHVTGSCKGPIKDLLYE